MKFIKKYNIEILFLSFLPYFLALITNKISEVYYNFLFIPKFALHFILIPPLIMGMICLGIIIFDEVFKDN